MRMMTERREVEYPIGDRLGGWRFRVEETCSGYWEAEGIRESDGETVLRTGTNDPAVALEERILDAMSFDCERP